MHTSFKHFYLTESEGFSSTRQLDDEVPAYNALSTVDVENLTGPHSAYMGVAQVIGAYRGSGRLRADVCHANVEIVKSLGCVGNIVNIQSRVP